MDAVIEKANTGLELKVSHDMSATKPSRQDAEEAVRTLIRWAGDNPSREGLADTPRRVLKAFDEFFAGYNANLAEILGKTFEEVSSYDDLVVLRGINVESHCEHHMVPIKGVAHVGYLPDGRVVGISKLARTVDAFARRLQTQETMTAQIADAIETYLKPRGVAVVIDATHDCMACRGVRHSNVYTLTQAYRGALKDKDQQDQFWRLVRANGPA